MLLRGQKVLLDLQLAELYGVETRALNQAVKRNLERFPEDFMFQLTWDEASEALRSQMVTSNGRLVGRGFAAKGGLGSQTVTLKRGQHLKYLPYAFTEQGVAMLSSVLRSPRAVQVNIAIMRTFVQLRQWLSSNAELARKLVALERKYDSKFRIVFDAIRGLMKRTEPETKPPREIGFHTRLTSTNPRVGTSSRRNSP